MTIALAQIASLKGDIAANITKHLTFIDQAVTKQADFIVFPELSLTNYEPSLAEKLALAANDERLHVFQDRSDDYQITIGIGAPVRTDAGIHIGLILFRPRQSRLVYHKKYLHADEKPFFTSGPNFPVFSIKGTTVGLAICYELSRAMHRELAVANGAEIYLASVSKTNEGVQKSAIQLSQMAQQNGITTLMVNGLGPSDNFIAAGQSAVWQSDGSLVQQLTAEQEGLLVYQTQIRNT
ncbi:MAG: carbon-nitrogen hydrolase family protein [Bacteroidota bacterium]